MFLKMMHISAAFVLLASSWSAVPPAMAAEPKQIKVCEMASREELAQLYRKKLVSNEQRGGCYWSLEPNGMAYLHIGLAKKRREPREYFNKNLSSHVRLEKINDLGDGGLMSVSEGSLGVVIIQKGDYILQSAVTFLEIEPGTNKHKVLWKIYARVLAELD